MYHATKIVKQPLFFLRQLQCLRGCVIFGNHVGDFPGGHFTRFQVVDVLLRHPTEVGFVPFFVFFGNDDLPARGDFLYLHTGKFLLNFGQSGFQGSVGVLTFRQPVRCRAWVCSSARLPAG